MVITKIERQKKNRRRFSIYSDDEFILGIHEDVLLKSGLHKGNTLDKAEFEKLESAEEFNLAKEKALRFISYRQRSEKEVQTKLLELEFLPSIIESVIGQLKDYEYLNDRKFTEAFVHDVLMKKPSGVKLLRRALILKGIAPAIIEEVLSEEFGKREEISLAREAAQKHMSRYRLTKKKPEQLKQQKRLADYLGRRGFAWDTISSVIKEIFRNTE